MNSNDKRLGMNRSIDRRDFLNGVGIALGASLLPAAIRNSASAADVSAFYYPPGETGMRGSHPGSFEMAHAAVRGQQWNQKKTDEHYDLVVVGAGISGLSAAYIYRRDVDPKARILILDNHDDFGGHAKRNEFIVDGKMLIGYGGTMMLESPKAYPAIAKQLIEELGINDLNESAYNHNKHLASLGLGRSTFFDKETFGADYLAVGNFIKGDANDDVPLSSKTKVELKRLYADDQDYLDGMTIAERRAVLETYSWRDYLSKFAKIGEEGLAFIQKRPHGVWAIGADALPAWMAWQEGYPGFADMDLGYTDDSEEHSDHRGNFRFPDGNATIARLLVRKLMPEVAAGNTMIDIVAAKFDYSKLDLAGNATRIRLSSTAVGLSHLEGNLDKEVEVTYVNDGDAKIVTASKVIWAGYHTVLPYICNDIPKEQVDALSSSVRAPLVYANVAIRNWRSLVKLGLHRASCPGSFFTSVGITHPVSFGDYRFATSPDEPIILHLTHIPTDPGLSAPDQFRSGRRTLLETPFDTFERNVRDQLGRMLGAGGFDPARDIAGITVNRWPHGYAYSVDEKTGDVAWIPEKWKGLTKPWVKARKRIGNIAIAGTDAASNAMTESAIEEAHRAVHSFTS